MVSVGERAQHFVPGDRVHVEWAGLVADGTVVDAYESVVGDRVVVDLDVGDDFDEPTRISTPPTNVSVLPAA